MAESVKAPLHFPCAARVKMPQIGSEDSDFMISRSKIDQSSSLSIQRAISFDISEKNHYPLEKTYINQISGDLAFSEDVVRDRCFHMLPYDDKYFWEAIDASQLIPIPPKRNLIVGRHNASGTDRRHMPCIPGKQKTLKPLKKKVMHKALKMHEDAVLRGKIERETSSLSSEGGEVGTEESEEQAFFMTEIDGQKPLTKKKAETKPKTDTNVKNETESAQAVELESSKEKKHDWGAYLMSVISPMTANWIVHQKMTCKEGREDLSKLLEEWYGKPEHTDLIRDDGSETEFQVKNKQSKKQPKKKWKKEEAVLLEKVFKTDQERKARDPYSDDNEAPFYRQPVGFRKQRKKIKKEEMGAINTTARDIQVKKYEIPPPPTLRDSFNPKAGDTLIETDNMFEREWLTGTEQLYQGENEEVKIVMSSQNKYEKQLQKEYPGSSETWYPADTEEGKVGTDDSPRYQRPTKGARRWKALPEPLDEATKKLKCLPAGSEPVEVVPSDAVIKKVTKQNPALAQIIDEWRNKWQLTGQFIDSSPEDLLQDMADIQPHVRLKAIATIGKAAEYKPPKEGSLHLEYQEQQNNAINNLPVFLFEALDCLLDDKHDQVKKAAAVTLFSLDKPTDKAEQIIRGLLFSESMADRWAAAQCLAHFGVCDSDVAGEVIRQLLATEDSIKHEQAIQLLAKMSASTTLIHSLVGEQLNSSSWRHRFIACKIFPTLDGTINKDITNKLSYLMWKDWHVEVRKAAAQTLGKTGHGRDVHDDLKDKIMGDDERLKLEAISRVGHLGIMTTKLLPAILDCFDNAYVSVRMEVCITCGNLLIKDEQILNKLLYLATFDTTWKVKALAIQALGKIGISSQKIIDSLLWALRFEEEAGVRAEACHSLTLLGYKEDDFIEILQERLLVEGSSVVREEMSSTLKQLGYSSNEDIDTVAQIKNEVRKLCDQSIIATQILTNEKNEEKQKTLSRMIYKAQEEVIRFFYRSNKYLRMNTKSDLDHRMDSKCTLQERKERENIRDEVLQKIKGRSQSSSGSSANSKSRNETLTPNREVEIILSRPDADYQSPIINAPSTPGTRPSSQSSENDDEESESESQRPLTSALSNRSHMDRIPEESDGVEFKTDTDLKSDFDLNSQFDTKSETDDTRSYFTSEDKSRQPTRENEVRRDDGDGESLLSDVASKDAKGEQPVGIRIDSTDYRSPVTPSYGERSMGKSSDRRTLMSRETLRERERINAEARKSLLTLNARYSSMIDNLREIDEGLSANQPIKPQKENL
ncbi:HEAT repeat-containing protein 4 isoform X2 [Patella vulgata]|uniref:HEAT repeat-containing protein 4 isoform X2 n=1 Tax=Patella vulgata TaxID=6465 RepID=UPI0024A8B30A|nr:HEAT repeat-containing protein 4 isoform X2 [Patella vulgata]